MVDRKEPTISGLRADPHDAPRQAPRTDSQSDIPKRRVVKKTVAPTAKAESTDTLFDEPDHSQRVVRQQVVKKGSSPILILLVLALFGGLGYTQWQLVGATEELKSAGQRIADLESRLEMTGDETEQSSAAIQAKLKWADSEIRKLWGVSYDRNKKAITENETKIKSLEGKVNSAQSGIAKEVKTQVAAETASLAKQVKALTGEVVVLNELVSANQAAANSARKVAADLGKIQTQVDTLVSKVENNEQSIESINAFRRSVNKQLLAQ